MFENLLPSFEILRGAPSTSYILDVKSDFRLFKKQTTPNFGLGCKTKPNQTDSVSHTERLFPWRSPDMHTQKRRRILLFPNSLEEIYELLANCNLESLRRHGGGYERWYHDKGSLSCTIQIKRF